VKTITASAAKKLGAFLTKDFRRIFGATHDDLAERLGALPAATPFTTITSTRFR
jgi:hypothetical protein